MIFYKPNSMFDEEAAGDSFLRSSLYQISSLTTSYGSFDSFDNVDYYQIIPGIGQFELIVTTEGLNNQVVYNWAYDIKTTDPLGNIYLGADILSPDIYSDSITFSSYDYSTYYVEINNALFGNFNYAATLNYLGPVGDGGTVVLVPSYALTRSASTVSEGQTATFTLATTNVSSGTSISYTISGIDAADIADGQLSGSVVVGVDGLATISVPLAADSLTEGIESLVLTIMGQAESIQIADVSLNPDETYEIEVNSMTVSEGEVVIFKVTTQNVPPGAKLPYSIHGISAEDIIEDLISETEINDQGDSYIRITIAEDSLLEGVETLTVSLHSQDKSASINVIDRYQDNPDALKFYLLTNSVHEGGHIEFKTYNPSDKYQEFQYSIFGVSEEDIGGHQISGRALVKTEGVPSKAEEIFSISIAEDGKTEGVEILDLQLPSEKFSVNVIDTSQDRLNPFAFKGSAKNTTASEIVIGSGTIDNYFYNYNYGLVQVKSITENGVTKISVLNPLDNEIDQLYGVERISFQKSRHSIALDTGGSPGSVYRLYKAAFARDPIQDTGGIGYWIAQMDNGMTLVEVAARFIDSSEFKKIYGETPSNGDFLTRLYSNVLNRAPDAAGLDWWINEMKTNPAKSWEKVLADFSESKENKDAVASLIAEGIMYREFLT